MEALENMVLRLVGGTDCWDCNCNCNCERDRESDGVESNVKLFIA